MAGYLLDTIHLAAAVLRISPVRERIHQLRRSGHRFGTCIPVLCELEVAIQSSGAVESCRRHLRTLRKEIRLWPIEPDIIQQFGELYIDLSRRGRILSHVDIVLAALARHMSLTILTTDRDFEALPEIHTENWLTAASE